MRLAVLPLLLLALAAEAGDDAKPVKGTLHGDVRWQGTVRLSGDVTIAEDAFLRIAPGTKVRIAENVKIEVHGEILAEGTDRDPIVFRPAVEETLWHSLILHPRKRDRSRLRWCVFERAFTGIQAGGDEMVFEDCVFFACRMGVGTGTLWASTDVSLATWPRSSPRLVRCRFGQCKVAVTVEGLARPHLERCIIHGCGLGVANQRDGVTRGLTGLGPFIDRCDFLFTSAAVKGPSRIVNSIFAYNGAALMPSNFQLKYGVSTDRVVRSHNLYFGNTRVVLGDTDIGAQAVFADPLFPGMPSPEVRLEHLLGDLGTGYGPRTASPVLGRASDGGDIGAVGASGSVLPWEVLPDLQGAHVFRSWLVLGPPALVEEGPRDLRKLGKKPPQPGQSVGDATWAHFETRGGAHPPFLDAHARDLWLVARCDGATAGRRELRIGADAVVRAWWNGTRLPWPERRRRFDADDLRVPVEVRKGQNVFLVQLEPWTSAPRFLARLVAPDEAEGVPARVAPARTWAGRRPSKVLRKAVADVPKRSKLAEGRILLHARVHWDTFRRGSEVVFVSPVGQEIRPSTLRVEPKRRLIVFEGARLGKGATYEVEVRGLVGPDGLRLPDETTTLAWR